MFFPFHFQLKFALYPQLNVISIKKRIINNKDTENSYQGKVFSITYVTFFFFFLEFIIVTNAFKFIIRSLETLDHGKRK